MGDYHKHPVNVYPQSAIRNRAKQRAYIASGARKFPANVLALFALIAAVIVVWNMAPMFATLFNTIPTLAPIFVYALRISGLLMVVLLFVGSLYLLGKPHRAREIENDLAVVFSIARPSTLFYRCPFLVACKPIKGTAAKEFVFWSRWQALECWNRPEIKQAVLWAINVHSVEDFVPGGKPYTVKIRAISGAIPEERETPQDPLF